MSAARAAVLGRVRAAIGEWHGEVPETEPGFRRSGSLDRTGRLRLLEERCLDYGATVRRTGEPAAAVEASLAAAGATQVAVPDDLPRTWLPEGIEWIGAGGLDVRDMDRVDAVVTGCALAVADIGAVVLDHGPGQGPRTLTLVPDHHVCVVEAENVVELMPEAISALHRALAAGLPLTFVAGPSATSDIGFQRVQGVHGPRRLDIVLIG